MRYAQINLEKQGPQQIVRTIEAITELTANDLIDISCRDDVTALSWYDVGVGDFVPAPIVASVVVIPSRVTMRQARLALHAEGLLDQVEAAIEALPESNRTEVRIEWDYAGEVHRASEFVTLLGTALELDKQSLDDLFLKAREL